MKRAYLTLFLAPMIVFLLLFIVYPYIYIIIRAFKNDLTGEFTLRYIKNVFTKWAFTNAWKNSLMFSSFSTGIAAVFGSLIGWISTKFSDRARGALSSLFSIPMTLSGLVVAFAFIVLLGRNGIFNIVFRDYLGLFHFDLYSWPGLAITYAFFNIPLFSLTMIAAFRNLDMSLVEAARNLGASVFQVWRYVILPVLAPSFLAATSIVFAGMMGAFGTALALTGMAKNLLSIQIYSHVSESNYNIPQADALAIVLGLTTASILLILNVLERKLRVKS